MKKAVADRLQKPRKLRTKLDTMPVASRFPGVNLKPEQEDVRGLGLNGAEQKPKSTPRLKSAGMKY